MKKIMNKISRILLVSLGLVLLAGCSPTVTPTQTVAEKLQASVAALAEQEIIPRRYFYPSLNTLPFMPKQISCPVSEDIAVRVLSLPLYVGLPHEDIERISSIINNSLLSP